MLDCQNIYNSLLKTLLEQQKDYMALMKSTIEENAIGVDRDRCCRVNSNLDSENSHNNYHSSNDSGDLIEWLRSINVDEESIKKVRIFQNR